MSGLVKALVAIQKEMQNPLKFHGERYPYVELDTILDVIRPIASAHGVAILQYMGEGEPLTLVTELAHESGESRCFSIPLKSADLKGGSAAQNLGASVTYARKYALMALFAIMGERDTDADPEKIPGRYAPQKLEPKKLPPDINFNTLEWLRKDIRWPEYIEDLARIRDLPTAQVEEMIEGAEFEKVKKSFLQFKTDRGYPT